MGSLSCKMPGFKGKQQHRHRFQPDVAIMSADFGSNIQKPYELDK